MSNKLGHTGKILWIDLSAKTWRIEDRDELFWRQYVGGGLLATALLLERCPAGIDPLGPENLLVFASSVVAGHQAPALVRFTTAAKSPLTGGIGETRTEGPWAIALKTTGVNAIVLEGQAMRPVVVVLEKECVSFHDADHCWGKTVGETVDLLSPDAAHAQSRSAWTRPESRKHPA